MQVQDFGYRNLQISFSRQDLEQRVLLKARLAMPCHSIVCDLYTAAEPLAALLLGKEGGCGLAPVPSKLLCASVSQEGLCL